MAAKIDQKEYLKKYLGGEKKKKRKKDKTKPIKGQTVKIVDDCDDHHNLGNLDDEELEAALQMNEEAPQIVGVIDERPPELRALDYKNSRWKSLADVGLTNQQEAKEILKQELILKKTGKQLSRRSPSPKRRKQRSPERSPVRPSSPRRKRDQTPDMSPVRKRSPDISPPRRKGRSPDLSPQRRRSPDNSPPRRRRRSSDLSPKRHRRSPDTSPRRKNRSPDMSPPRRRHQDTDLSPIRRSNHKSPSRQSKSERKSRWADERSSPPRHNKSEPKPSRYKPTPSPPRRQQNSRLKKSRSRSPPPTHRKMADGKKSGLQHAHDLRIENEDHRRREMEMYENMSAETSGRGAEARIRATGAVDRRKIKAQLAKEQEANEKYEKRKEVYDKWGKGLKQVEDYKQRLESAAHEAAKPMARYADDEDLQEHLKQQDRLEDPMREYFQSKRKEKRIKDRVPEKPTYQGLFPDNRFNIRPGYRWDGVDRSNGFEKRLFETKNLREAAKEEAYHYSTEDM